MKDRTAIDLVASLSAAGVRWCNVDGVTPIQDALSRARVETVEACVAACRRVSDAFVMNASNAKGPRLEAIEIKRANAALSCVGEIQRSLLPAAAVGASSSGVGGERPGAVTPGSVDAVAPPRIDPGSSPATPTQASGGRSRPYSVIAWAEVHESTGGRHHAAMLMRGEDIIGDFFDPAEAQRACDALNGME